MEMRADQLNTLKKLFALSRDAVVGAVDGRVVYANAAAGELFGREIGGEALKTLLPELDGAGLGDGAVTAVTLAGAGRTVSCAELDGVLVLTLSREAVRPAAGYAALLSRMRSAAFQLRCSIDRVLPDLPEGDDEAGRILSHSYYCLAHLIGQLSDAEGLSRGNLFLRSEPVELGQLARDLVSSTAWFTRGRDVALSFECPAADFPVQGDFERLEQLILILLTNALLHTPAGGHVRVGLTTDGSRHILSVDDDGEGMDETALAYAFSLREAVTPAMAANGAGLGLYLAYGLARCHGGTVVLRSEPGRGTRVRVSLPAGDELPMKDVTPGPARGPELLLTELCDVLGAEAYDLKYRD